MQKSLGQEILHVKATNTAEDMQKQGLVAKVQGRTKKKDFLERKVQLLAVFLVFVFST